VAHVDPLGEVTEQGSRVFSGEVDGVQKFLVSGKATEAVVDAARGDVFAYLGEEMIRNLEG
jgi:hypothetical protein